MEDNNEMDLALNGDFDSELFDCWDSAADQEPEPAVANARATSDNPTVGNSSQPISISLNEKMHHGKPASTDTENWTAHASSSVQPQPRTSEQGMFAPSDMQSIAAAGSQGATVSVSDAASSSTPSYHQLLSTFANMPAAHQRSLDPRAILSSANCPPHAGRNSATVSSSADSSSLPAVSGSSITNNDGSMAQSELQHNVVMPQQQQAQFDLTSAALLPLAMNALAAGVTLPLPLVLQAAQQAMHQHSSAQQQPHGANVQHPSYSGVSGQHSQAPTAPVPPYAPATAHLFDAPGDLRANFLHSQRGVAAPMLHDPNHPYPFGIAVNGFHPQNNMGGGQQPQPVDERQNIRNNMKNVKEQKRAQKITDLIDNLRTKMEKDGWQVGLSKSKFNTLSCCAEYIRHLVTINEEKEATVKKTQCDLEAARKKLDDDKIHSDRSDPESTTSSLTVSSGSAATHSKRTGLASSDAHADNISRGADQHVVGDEHEPKRLQYQESGESGTSATGSKMGYTESVSDITDSNKGSSTNSGSGSGSDEACSEPVAKASKAEEALSDDDVLSDAAVAKRKAEEQHYSCSRKNKKYKLPWLPVICPQQEFDLDFEEVFLNSNIPQMLATTDGRILAWNTFFLKATGFNGESIKKATIFGLVRCSKLANLFEIVAKALRNKSQPIGNYLATTLPCIKFSACQQRQLYITVTFMADVDPRKRCFHCVLTDSPPTTESPGPVTEELLLMLLSESGESKSSASTKANGPSDEPDMSETESKLGSMSDKADDEPDEEEGTADEEPFSVDDDGDTVSDAPEMAEPKVMLI